MHLTLETEARLVAGHSPDEARRAAHVALGNVGRIREEARAVWMAAWLQGALQDLRYAARVFLRTPVFTAVAGSDDA